MTLKRAAATLAGLLVLAGCGGRAASTSSQAPSPTPTPTPTVTPTSTPTPSSTPSPTTPTRAPRPKVQPLVLAISVDGLNPTALAKLGPSRAPNFARLVAEGASTLDARTSFEQTVTLPGHTGMLTGLPVGGAYGHHVTVDEDPGRTLAQLDGRYVPSVFDVAHDHGLSTALYASKPKFEFFVRTWAEHGAADTTGPDNGADKIDQHAISTPQGAVADAIAELTGPSPDAFTFLHIAEPDHTGHAKGWLSPAYLAAVAGVDAEIGQILDAIDAHPALKRRITVILTSDHGGRGVGHANPTVADDYTIPFFVWGRGVAKGADLYALNADRRNPGTSRPGYSGPQPVRNMDLADLSLSLLGLPSLPHTLAPGEQALRVS